MHLVFITVIKTEMAVVVVVALIQYVYLHNDIFLTNIVGYDRLNLVKFVSQKWHHHSGGGGDVFKNDKGIVSH